MSTLIHERVKQSREGKNPKVICKVKSGWVVMGDTQFLTGYCLLLSDPVVESLNDLSKEERESFLSEMTVLGDALLKVTGCYRVNYDISGNTEPALHAHIIPRYLNEDDEKRRKPACFYDWGNAPQFDSDRCRDLMDDIHNYLMEAGIVVTEI